MLPFPLVWSKDYWYFNLYFWYKTQFILAFSSSFSVHYQPPARWYCSRLSWNLLQVSAILDSSCVMPRIRTWPKSLTKCIGKHQIHSGLGHCFRWVRNPVYKTLAQRVCFNDIQDRGKKKNMVYYALSLKVSSWKWLTPVTSGPLLWPPKMFHSQDWDQTGRRKQF